MIPALASPIRFSLRSTCARRRPSRLAANGSRAAYRGTASTERGGRAPTTSNDQPAPPYMRSQGL
eukprot:12671231-Alexandrium_andersonii.AAC.1